MFSVTDKEIIDSYIALARKEGVYCEPASAAAVAGLLKLSGDHIDFSNKVVTCVITGNGLKDPDTSDEYAGANIFEVQSDFREILKIISQKD
tara:strand:- start:917 stop:1192 length:276 start_codon:yes stop_codon:yes gene_type:complete